MAILYLFDCIEFYFELIASKPPAATKAPPVTRLNNRLPQTTKQASHLPLPRWNA